MAHDSDPAYVLAAAAVFLALSPIFTSLRLWVRIQSDKHRMGADDYLAVLALFLVMGCCITTITGVRLGVLAYPADKTNPAAMARQFTLRNKIQYSFFLMQILAMGSIKLSFVTFFRRIFHVRGSKSTFGIVSASVGLLILLWMTAYTLWSILLCGASPWLFWASQITLRKSCPTALKFDLSLAISDFLTDIFVLALPIPMVIKLHVRLARKLMILGVFSIGLVALAASALRLAIFSYDTRLAAGQITNVEFDEQLTLTTGIYWSTLEGGLALLACNLPTLGPLFKLQSVRSFVASIRSLRSLGSASLRISPRRDSDGEAQRLAVADPPQEASEPPSSISRPGRAAARGGLPGLPSGSTAVARGDSE